MLQSRRRHASARDQQAASWIDSAGPEPVEGRFAAHRDPRSVRAAGAAPPPPPHTAPDAKWGPALLPAPTLPWHGARPKPDTLLWRGFRPRPFGPGRFPFGFFVRARKAPFRKIPGLPGKANFARSLAGPLGSKLPRFPGTAFPKRTSAALPFRTFRKEQAPHVGSDRFGKNEANFVIPDLSRFPLRPKTSWVRWTGSEKWGRLRLSPLPRASSRPRPASFGFARHPRRFAAFPPLSAAASDPLSRFRGGFSSAALEQCAPDSIRAIGPSLWITGISGMELIQFNAARARSCSFAAPSRRASGT